MSDITVNYKGSAITTMDASGTKTLLTEGKYCEDDIEIVYVQPSGGGGSVADVLLGDFPSGAVSFKATKNVPASGVAGRGKITSLTIDLTDDKTLSGYSIRSNGGTFSRLILLNASSYDTPLASVRHASYAITDNSALTQVIIRGLSRAFNTSGVRANTALQVVDIEGMTHPNGVAAIASSMFYGDTNFNVLILRATGAVIPLDNINAFTNSKFASGKGGGTLYVPNSMISSYQQASNWSTLLGYATNSIVKLEDSPYESLTWYES